MIRLPKILLMINVLLILGIGWMVSDYQKLRGQYRVLKYQITMQQAILQTYLQLSTEFNQISRINLSQRNQTNIDSEKTKTVIQKVLVNNDCANVIVPHDAVSQLYQHAQRIQSSAVGENSQSPTR